ncbi:MAG: hypothetical protein Kow0042_08650 [Calditrichia bacterium]
MMSKKISITFQPDFTAYSGIPEIVTFLPNPRFVSPKTGNELQLEKALCPCEYKSNSKLTL